MVFLFLNNSNYAHRTCLNTKIANDRIAFVSYSWCDFTWMSCIRFLNVNRRYNDNEAEDVLVYYANKYQRLFAIVRYLYSVSHVEYAQQYNINVEETQVRTKRTHYWFRGNIYTDYNRTKREEKNPCVGCLICALLTATYSYTVYKHIFWHERMWRKATVRISRWRDVCKPAKFMVVCQRVFRVSVQLAYRCRKCGGVGGGLVNHTKTATLLRVLC